MENITKNKTSILIIDDKQSNILAYEAVLEELDLNIISVCSGLEGINEILIRDYACILLDVRMPLLSGFETAKIIKERFEELKTPIIFITAYHYEEIDILKGYSYGAVDYVLSPVMPEVLKSKVRVFVELFEKNKSMIELTENLKIAQIQLTESTSQVNTLNERLISFNIELEEKIKERSKELYFSEKLYHGLVDNALVGIFRANKNGEIIYANGKFNQMLEIDSPEEINTILLGSWIENPEVRQGFIKKLMEAKEVENYEAVSLTNKSNIKNFIMNARLEGEQITGMMLDYTEQNTLNKNYIAAKEKAEESDQLKIAFLRNISHEIRTPLNGLFGFSELMKEGNLTNEEYVDFLDSIQKCGKRLLDTISDIVDASKIETGQMKLNVKEININEMLEGAYLNFNYMAKAKNLDMTCLCELSDEDCIITSDYEKISKALSKLIDNAVKFTDSGGIEFGYKLKESMIEFFVKDTGCGIPEEDREKVFERFIQEDISLSRAYEGSGLGLSLAKAFIEFLGGKIWIEPGPDSRGTIFYFNIPSVPTAESQSESEKKDIQENKLQFANILVVEDDESSLLLIKRILETKNLNSFYALNGLEALEVVKTNPGINIVLMDLKIPLMNGFETTRQIKLLRPDLPIIAQTAFAFPEDAKQAKLAGCCDLIVKPLSKSALLNILQMHL